MQEQYVTGRTKGRAATAVPRSVGPAPAPEVIGCIDACMRFGRVFCSKYMVLQRVLHLRAPVAGSIGAELLPSLRFSEGASKPNRSDSQCLLARCLGRRGP